MKTLLAILLLAVTATTEDHDPMYWQVDSVTEPVYASGFMAWNDSTGWSCSGDSVLICYKTVTHYSRIPGRWEMRVDTNFVCKYYSIPNNSGCLVLPRESDKLILEGQIVSIDTIWAKKQLYWFTADEIRRVEEWLHPKRKSVRDVLPFIVVDSLSGPTVEAERRHK